MNDIVRVELKLQQPLVADTYAEKRVSTGSFILIDGDDHDTVGRGDCLIRPDRKYRPFDPVTVC